jgi:hypothetical protein
MIPQKVYRQTDKAATTPRTRNVQRTGLAAPRVCKNSLTELYMPRGPSESIQSGMNIF